MISSIFHNISRRRPSKSKSTNIDEHESSQSVEESKESDDTSIDFGHANASTERKKAADRPVHGKKEDSGVLQANKARSNSFKLNKGLFKQSLRRRSTHEINANDALPSFDCMSWTLSIPVVCDPYLSRESQASKFIQLDNTYKSPIFLCMTVDNRWLREIVAYELADLPRYDSVTWSPSRYMPKLPHQTLKTRPWKELILIDFNSANIHRPLPSYACMKWKPAHRMQSYPHQTYKAMRWRAILADPNAPFYRL